MFERPEENPFPMPEKGGLLSLDEAVRLSLVSYALYALSRLYPLHSPLHLLCLSFASTLPPLLHPL
jgi:hypothetical protein